MFDLLGLPLFITVVALAVAATAGIVVLWSRPRREDRRVLRLVGRIGLVLLSQFLVLLAVVLLVNRAYSFYTSWDDVFGVSRPPESIEPNRVKWLGGGKLEVVSVPGTSVTADVLMWLPPGYTAATGQRYPVVVFLPGHPSTPPIVFDQYRFGEVATRLIEGGEIKPFVAVFPPITIAPPRDTECVDVPDGPQAETWLREVRTAVLAAYPVATDASRWSVMGWSAGATCAAKLVFRDRGSYGAAVGFGGYYEAYEDATTGDLFRGDPQLRDQHSPTWLYRERGLRGARLLVIAGVEDTESYESTWRLLDVSAGDPGVFRLIFPAGGHNDRNYGVYLVQSLRWLAQGGSFG